jgi:NH3-dependent NAD+ synthetase
MDLCLYGRDHDMEPGDLAPIVELTEDQVKRAYSMIDSKRKNARYLHLPAMLCPPA